MFELNTYEAFRLAAKAAGLRTDVGINAGVFDNTFGIYTDEGWFNPLASSEHSFKLMVLAGIQVIPDEVQKVFNKNRGAFVDMPCVRTCNRVYEFCETCKDEMFHAYRVYEFCEDSFDATRQSILETAAKIGAYMENFE